MNTQRSDQIALRGLRVRGYHGVLPEERKLGQIFVIDAVLDVDTRPAAAGDDLTKTVDYAVLAQQVTDVVAGEPVDLIETLAQRLADVCLASDLVEAVEIVVHKPDAPVPLPFEDVTVSIRRTRD
jgi:dihydroneopterin aldolase